MKLIGRLMRLIGYLIGNVFFFDRAYLIIHQVLTRTEYVRHYYG